MATLASVFKGNSKNSIGGPARILISPVASYAAVPASMANIIDLSTYAAQLTTYGWQDAGFTRVPTRVSDQAAVTQWTSEQTGIYRVKPGSYTGQVVCEFLEVTPANKSLLMLASRQTDSAAQEAATYYPAHTSFPYFRIACLRIDDNGLLHISWFPKCQWGGAAIQQTFGRTEPETIPMTWEMFADEDFIDPVTGDPCFRIDFDQYAT